VSRLRKRNSFIAINGPSARRPPTNPPPLLSAAVHSRLLALLRLESSEVNELLGEGLPDRRCGGAPVTARGHNVLNYRALSEGL